jgi:predicted ATPase
MLSSIQFQNFKILRDGALPLSPFTLLVGPNGSGKSTVLEGLEYLAGAASSRSGKKAEATSHATVTHRGPRKQDAHVIIEASSSEGRLKAGWSPGKTGQVNSTCACTARVYHLRARSVGEPAKLVPGAVLQSDGGGLAAVLDRLRDRAPEAFAQVNARISQWIPSFDQILFDTPSEGMRSIMLRSVHGYAVPAQDLSEGTLLALAMLTIAHMPEAPDVIGLEEPDRAIHPRLLADVHRALQRLAFPAEHGSDSKPIQVVATTHSPYFLDLFRETPEQVVICELVEDNVAFQRLSDLPHYQEILADSHLGEAWYSGVLGGVTTKR